MINKEKMSGDSGNIYGAHVTRLSKIGQKIRLIALGLENGLHPHSQPFAIGKVEKRMKDFASTNGITIASDEVYMSVRQIRHAERPTKQRDDVNVGVTALSEFPQMKSSMKLFYDKDSKNFTYTDMVNKFILHPNYKIRISKNQTMVVNFITSLKVKDRREFLMPKYIEVT